MILTSLRCSYGLRRTVDSHLLTVNNLTPEARPECQLNNVSGKHDGRVFKETSHGFPVVRYSHREYITPRGEQALV